MIEGYKTVNEIAKEWGLKPRTIQIMCSDGRISGATKFGKAWAIPSDIQRPVDGRETTGQYKNWRKKGLDEKDYLI